MANEALRNKTEIVKTLLKYGADPESLRHAVPSSGDEQAGGLHQSPGMVKKVEEGMNPAMK